MPAGLPGVCDDQFVAVHVRADAISPWKVLSCQGLMVPPEVVLRGSRVVALVLVSLASAGVALLVEDHAPFPFPPGRLSPCPYPGR